MEEFHPGLILCPTDFSESPTWALRHAGEFTRFSQANMLVILNSWLQKEVPSHVA